MSTPVTVTDTSFDAEVLKSDLVVVACFCAEWNPTCVKNTAVLDEIAQEYASKVKVARLDVDDCPTAAANLAVLNVPTVIVYKNGQAVERIEGSLSKDKLVHAFSGYLPQG